MFNLFIVRSPLQLINATEAKEHFKTKHNILMLMNNNQSDKKQLETVLSLSKWDEIIHYKPQKGSSLFQQVKLVRSLKHRAYHYLFSGDYGTINKMMMANLSAKAYYLIDDGTMSIEIHKQLQHPSTLPWSKKMKLLRYRLFALRTSMKKPLNFFTCYDLSPLKGSKIIPNDYHYLQSVFQPKHPSDDIYLLGQNIDDKWLRPGAYLHYIKEIREYYKEQTIIYMPHRHEIISNELHALFDEKFVLRPNDIPIELYFLEKSIYPKHIISFTSSALFTLNKIYPKTKIDAIVLQQDDLVMMHGFVKSCYEFFDGLSINQIDLTKGTT